MLQATESISTSNRDKSLDWLSGVSKALQDQKSPGRVVFPLAKGWITGQNDSTALEEWMEGTYLEDGKLIRRGT